MAQALAAVCSTAGKNIGIPAKAAIIDLVEEAFAAGRSGKALLTLALTTELIERRKL